MTNIAPFVEIDNIFRNICGVVGDALQVVRDTHQIQAAGDGMRIFNHETGQLAVELAIEEIDLLVALDDLAGQIGFRVNKRIERIVNHSPGMIGHARNIHQRFQERFPVQLLGPVGDVHERTIAENPDHADACEALAAMHFRRHNFVESLAALRRCVAIDPTRAEVHMRIHTMAQIVGDRDLALDHQRQALEVTRLFTERGVDALRPHLLLLKAAGDWQANLPTDFIVKRDDWGAVYHYFVSADGPPPFEDLPFCDVIFNAVAEPDLTRGELNTADAIIAALAQPVLNRPDRVAATGRADVAALLDDIPHLQVPTTLRLSGSDAAAILESALAAGRIALPVLLRPVGSHAGQGVRLVGERAELASAIRQFSGSDLYATRYVDYRNADGLFRKYRVIVVDGRPYPFHMAISKRWLVHYYNAVIDDPAMMDREEERFLGEFETVFAPELRAAFVEMARRLELDFFGVDCTIGPDGRLLLFEVDVGVIVHVMDDPVRHAYKHKYVPRIFEAVKKMIEGRVAAKFAVASH